MSPPIEMNAGCSLSMAATRAWRTAGLAGPVSAGSWKRVSPKATKANSEEVSRAKAAWFALAMGCSFGLLEAQAPPRQAKKSRKAGQQLRQIPIPVGYDSVAKYGLTLFQQPGSNSRKSGALLRWVLMEGPAVILWLLTMAFGFPRKSIEA